MLGQRKSFGIRHLYWLQSFGGLENGWTRSTVQNQIPSLASQGHASITPKEVAE